MNKSATRALGVIASVILASCGGGGDSGSGTAATTAPTSFWSMDSYTYVNGGFSSQSTSPIGDKQATVVVVSTATPAGGDKSNGAYSGSSLTFSFFGSTTGTYNIVASPTALINADPTTNPIVVQSTVGAAVTTGSSMYTATSGQVTVTYDTSGKPHFSSLATLSTTKTLDVLGGVAQSPAAMSLIIRDAF